jgi:hypothetical protein
MKAQTQWLFETPPTTQQGKFDFEGNSNSINWETSSDWLFESPLPSTPPYTQCDFIDPRIDVDAQYALFEMLKGDIPTRTAAISMFSAVQNGSLGGIYKENQQVPAKRAQRIGKTWWTLIPSGQSAICVTLPPSEPPIIVFKKSLTNRFQLGQALRTAWSTCGVPIPTPFPPSGKICPNRPKVIDLGVFPDDPPKQPPPTCNQDEFKRELQRCQQHLTQCLEKCSMNKAVLWKQLLSIPSAKKCIDGTKRLPPRFRIPGIGGCILVYAGKAAYDLYNEYQRVSKCEENCRKLLAECQRLARSSSGC